MDVKLHPAAAAREVSSIKPRTLVVTADDFGLAEEVNEAIALAHASGILSAASLMVSAPAAADAVRRAHALPMLRVGLHLVLVAGRATLPPEQIPDLIDASGRLRSDLPQLGIAIACRPRVRRQMRAEIVAQFEAYRRTGLVLDHVDVHKHFHLHPVVAQDLLTIGRRYGMRALRVPAEPVRILARLASAGLAIRPTLALLAPWAALLRHRARRQGILVPDAVIGLAFSGAFTTERMIEVLERLPTGLVEIYVHPASTNTFPGHAAGYRYTDELAALCHPSSIAAWRRSGARLGGYADALRSGFQDQPCPAEGRSCR